MTEELTAGSCGRLGSPFEAKIGIAARHGVPAPVSPQGDLRATFSRRPFWRFGSRGRKWWLSCRASSRTTPNQAVGIILAAALSTLHQRQTTTLRALAQLV